VLFRTRLPVLLAILILLSPSCSGRQPAVAHPREGLRPQPASWFPPRQEGLFEFGTAAPEARYPKPRTSIEPGIAKVRLVDVLERPKSFSNRRVAIAGCYTVDPYHGGALVDGRSAITLLGGSDDIGGRPFDYARDRVCGTLVGTVLWRPSDEPITYLCPELCFFSDYTVSPRIVSSE